MSKQRAKLQRDRASPHGACISSVSGENCSHYEGTSQAPQKQVDGTVQKIEQTEREAMSKGLTKTHRNGPLNALADACHKANRHWWHHPVTGERLERNKGELLMLIVTEVAETMEGERKELMDDHLPHRLMAEVELADVLIRVFDYAGAFGYDLDGAVSEKLVYNAQRPDHKAEARLRAGGKKW